MNSGKLKVKRLTHVDRNGELRMVSVTQKRMTKRQAIARTEVTMSPDTLARVRQNRIAKGDVLATAKIAGLLAAKRTDELIPLCHTIPLSDIDITFTFATPQLLIEARAACVGRTGPELEALTAASIAALTIYDMCKAVHRGMVIGRTYLVQKSGGKSGTWTRVTPP